MRFCDRRSLDHNRLRRAGFVMLAALGLTMLAGSGARAAAISFLPPVTFAKPGVLGLLAADLDGDGKLDLAATGGGSVSFFYGKGDGTFEPRVDLPLGDGLHDVQAADLNGDGRPDLVITQNNTVLVLLSQGPRTYAPPVSYPVGTPPCGVTVADLNGDGFPDLAVSNAGSNNVCVLLNNGDGTFAPPVFYPAGAVPGVIISADLRGNGLLDLAVANIVSGNVRVYSGDGLGHFTVGGDYSSGGYAGQVVADDFNGDGNLDLATSNWMGSSISVLLGDGSGALSPAILYPGNTYPAQLASADLNGDGAPDLVTGDGGSNYFTVHQNAGDGTFLPPVTFPAGGSDVRSLVVGDFNGDGLPDAVTGNWSDGTIAVCLNNTSLPSPAILSLTLDRTTPIGGSQVINGKVTLTAPAPAGGAVVTITTNNSAVNVPPTVTIPEGQTTAGIVLGTTPVAAPQHGTVTAGLNGTAKRMAVTVRAPAARFAVLTPDPFTGGQPATGKVTLEVPTASDVVVTLSSSNPAVLSLPATVTIPAGQSSVSFGFKTNPVSVPTTVFVTVSAPGATTTMAAKVGDLGAPLPAVNGTGSPPVYNPDNGHWYQAVTVASGITWPAARDAAAALSYDGLPGHLVTITSAAENQFLVNNLPLSLDDHWRVGGYQDHNAPDYSEPAGGWRWVTGEPWSYTNWRGGEPNNANGGEDFLEIHSDGTWNDIAGWYAGANMGGYGYIVEYEAPPAPPVVPTTLAATAASPFQVNLSWTDNGGVETSFEVQRKDTGDWAQIALPSASSTTYADNQLGGGTHFTYRVRAVGPGGTSGWSNEASVDVPTVAGVSLDASSHDFGMMTMGSAGPTQTMTLTNNGNAPLVLGNLALTGANPGDFTVTPSATTIAPGQQATLSIGFNPAAPGSRSAVLTINSNAPGTAPTISLTGSVMMPLSQYVIVDLGTELGAPVSNNADLFSGKLRLGLNAAGVVAGWVPSADGGSHAAISDVHGTDDLGWLVHSGSLTMATGINAAGQITGLAADPNGSQSQAFVAQTQPAADGGLQALATTGLAYVAGHAINDAGEVVGLASPFTGPEVAFRYDSTGLHNLGDLGGGSSDAFAINHAGQIVGWALTAGRAQHAFLYDSAGMHDLGTLPGSAGGSALAINDAGQVVGQSYVNSQGYRAFLYDSAGMHDLGISGQAYGINNLGQIVGASVPAQAGPGLEHAFIESGGVMTDLNSLLPAGSAWVLNEADAINDAGQIVGLGTVNGQQHAFLLTFPSDPRATPPAAPSGLVVSGNSTSELDLDWTDTDSSNEWGFEIQRKSAGGDWGKVTVAKRDNRTYVDTGLTAYTQYTYRVRAINGSGVSGWSNEAGGDTGTQGKLTSSASGALDFGSQAVGTASAPQTVTLTNNGNGPLTISSLTVAGNVPPPATTGTPATGSQPGEFAISPALTTPVTLAPGESLSVSLVFTPAVNGPRAAALTIADDAPGGGATVTLTGTGSGAVVRVMPSNLDFGNEPVGLGTALAVLIQNKGNAPLTVSKIDFQGTNAGDFSLATDGIIGQTLLPGDIALLNIRFSPTATGSRSATLVLTDDAADSPQSIPLTGTGTDPLLLLSADSLIFGLQSGSSTQTLTLTNSGVGPLNISGLALTGPDAGHFKIISDTGEQSLPVGGSRTVQIAFQTATVAGAPHHARIAAVSYSATLEIQHNDPHPGAPHTVSLLATADPGASADTTPPPPPPGFTPATPPAAPSGLSARAPSAGEVDLAWSDNSNNEQAFAIWRQGGGQDWSRVGIMGPHATSYVDTTVQPGVGYTYKVRAVNGGGASDWSNTVVLTPGAPPAAPTGLMAGAAGSGVSLTWSHNSTGEQAFAIWRQGGGQDWARVGIAGPGSTSYADTGARPNTGYSYRVRAINRFGASDWSNTVSLTPGASAPAAPTGLAASGTGTQVSLTWASNSSNEQAFAIWRQGGGQDWARVGIVGPHATSYTDATASPNTAYSYKVRAVNGSGASDWSNTVSVTTPAAPPAAPTGLAATVTGGQVTLTWTNPSTDAHAFAIWRQGGGQDWARVGIAGPQATSYTDSGLAPGTSYTYRLRAIGAGGASGWSNAVSVLVPAAP